MGPVIINSGALLAQLDCWARQVQGTLQGTTKKSLLLNAYLSLHMETWPFTAMPYHRVHTPIT